MSQLPACSCLPWVCCGGVGAGHWREAHKLENILSVEGEGTAWDRLRSGDGDGGGRVDMPGALASCRLHILHSLPQPGFLVR